MNKKEDFDELIRPVEAKWYVRHAAEIAVIIWVCIMGGLLMLMD